MSPRWPSRSVTCTSEGSCIGKSSRSSSCPLSSRCGMTDIIGRYQIGVNRDIKPDNILLDEKGHAHLTDFNIAVHFTERRALTSVAGSMAYMGAPCSDPFCVYTSLHGECVS